MNKTFEIQHNISLSDKTWFQTGGTARFYAEPQTVEEFGEALAFAQTTSLEVFVLGAGANILISDSGFDGLVIKPLLTSITLKHLTDSCQKRLSFPSTDSTAREPLQVLVTAQAGVLLPSFILYCLEHHLIGLEEFAGIPGTIGGSAYINIHYFEFLLSHFMTHATVIHSTTGVVTTVDVSWFQYGYNQSMLLTKEYYLIDATFKLKKGTAQDAAYARGRHDEIIRHRNRRYPHERTCGSFFRNFLPEELPQKDMLPFVAHYFEGLDMKGKLRHGKAIVFSRHANMIITEQGATSNDVVALARMMQQKVFARFGLLPQPECQLIGFKSYPLLLKL